MNFKIKAQLMSEYFDKLYDRLLRDSQKISDWEILTRACSIEGGKLSNYAMAIQDEIISEIMEMSGYKNLNTNSKERLVAEIGDIRIGLKIPEFILLKSECTENVSVPPRKLPSSEREVPTRSPHTVAYTVTGAVVGAVVGAGMGIAISKTVPLLLIGGVVCAAGGRLLSGAVGQKDKASLSKGSLPKTPEKTVNKINHSKFELTLSQRKKVVSSIFQRYLNDLENVCRVASQ